MFPIPVISKTNTVTPNVFAFLTWVGHYLTTAKVWKKSERGKILGANVLEVISFGKQSTKETLETRIANPATFWPWNPESTDVESGIHRVESRIQGSLGLPYMGRFPAYGRYLRIRKKEIDRTKEFQLFRIKFTGTKTERVLRAGFQLNKDTGFNLGRFSSGDH